MVPHSFPQTQSKTQISENDIQLSYFVKKRKGSPSRVCSAKLLDISNTGLCMEISEHDSELYMESQGSLFLLNKNIEIQMFCRSYPTNISMEGQVKWLQRPKESDTPENEADIHAGILFCFDGTDQRIELANLVSLLKKEVIICRECGASVSGEVALCYSCGCRLVRKRAFFRKIIDNLIAGAKPETSR